MKRRDAIRLWLLCLCLHLAPTLPAANAQSLTPASLVAAGELEVRAVIDSEPPYYQRAPLILAVEIATPRWFSRGSRVRDFRVPNAVVLPVSSFADKLTRRERGQSWTVQRWRFRIYPREAGDLQFPVLTVFVSVNHESGATVEGEFQLTPPPLSIEAPPGTEALGDWIAAASLEVEDRWEGLRESYLVGDAITRIREIRVDDAPAMMIPALPQPGRDDIPGLSLYQAPAEVEDRRDRGSLRGLRREKLVITIEAPGDYALPASTLHWFDHGERQLRETTLGGLSFSASSAGMGGDQEPSTSPVVPWPLIAAGLFSVSLAAIVAFGTWRWQRGRGTSASRRQPDWLQRWQRRRRYRRALAAGNAIEALAALHRAARHRGCTVTDAARGDAVAETTLRQLLAAGYSANPAEMPSRADQERLWRQVTQPSTAPQRTRQLSLNPGSPSF